jgi:hypothetical protein
VSLSSGLQTLIVKSRLLTGENSVQIRGDPPASARGASARRANRGCHLHHSDEVESIQKK